MPGPLVPVWRSVEHGTFEAGAPHDVVVEVANAGTAPWRTRGPEDGLFLSYHWLDDRGNPIIWDGHRTPLDHLVAPGDTLRQAVQIRGPIPPGPYRLAVDLVEEHRFWVSELGTPPWEQAIDVTRRDASQARVFGADPDDDWVARARELHAEGYGAVGGAVVGGAVEGSKTYTPGGGRNPRFPHPLVCPSLLPPLEPNCEVDGRPAWQPERDEPFMYDGRLVLRLR